ncbi:MAG TPA: hypothetical protein VGP15_20670 [Burkholderiales bacterium]|jgi:hypothetical protein|nr:hypothetical protein [Burkholderiales bacterium]
MASETGRAERRTRWSFGCSANNTWFWCATAVDGSTRLSEARFETLADALRDAASHGFVIWNRAEERRQDDTERLIAKVSEAAG